MTLHRVPNSTIFHLECKCGRQSSRFNQGAGEWHDWFENRAIKKDPTFLGTLPDSGDDVCEMRRGSSGTVEEAEQPFQFQLIKAPFRRQTLISGKAIYGDAKQN